MRFSSILGASVASIAMVCCNSFLHGQSTGVGGSGGLTGGTGSVTTPTTTGTQTGGTQTGSTGTGSMGNGSSAGGSAGNNPIDLTQNQLNLGSFTNDRVQPFVGPSMENITHPRSNSTIAGGGGGGGAGGNRLGALGSALRNRGGGQFGNQMGNNGLGFNSSRGVPRRGVRGALRYDYAPANTTAIAAGVAPSFLYRIERTPGLDDVAGLDVSVENRVATLRGTVGSPEAKQLLERQLLLEPGVSQVVNLLEVQQ